MSNFSQLHFTRLTYGDTVSGFLIIYSAWIVKRAYLIEKQIQQANHSNGLICTINFWFVILCAHVTGELMETDISWGNINLSNLNYKIFKVSNNNKL